MKLNFNYCSCILFLVLNIVLGILLIFLGNDLDYEIGSLTICLFLLWYLKNNYFVDYCKKISLLVTIVNSLLILVIICCGFKLYTLGPNLNFNSTIINILISSVHCGDEAWDYPVQIEPDNILERTTPIVPERVVQGIVVPERVVPEILVPLGIENNFTPSRIMLILSLGLSIPLAAYHLWGLDWEILRSIWENRVISPRVTGTSTFLPTFPILPGSFPIGFPTTFPIVPLTPVVTASFNYSLFRHISLGLGGFSGITYPLIELNLSRIDAPKGFFERLFIFSQQVDFDLSRIFNAQSPLRLIITTEPNSVMIQRFIKSNKIVSILTIEGMVVFITYFIG